MKLFVCTETFTTEIDDTVVLKGQMFLVDDRDDLPTIDTYRYFIEYELIGKSL